MAGKKPHAADKRKRVKFKARHPEGRSVFAKAKKAERTVKNTFMEPAKREELDKRLRVLRKKRNGRNRVNLTVARIKDEPQGK